MVALATAVDLNKIKIQASLLGTFIFENVTAKTYNNELSEYVLKENIRDSKKEFTPSIFLSYKPSTYIPLNIRAFYKRIFRMPTFNDLYYTDIGNISLLPEYTNQYNLGFQYEKHRSNKFLSYFMLKADIYYNEVTDKIISVPKGNGQYRWMMMNIGYVEIRGIETGCQTSFNLPFNIFLRCGLNYSYQKAQDFSDPSDNDFMANSRVSC